MKLQLITSFRNDKFNTPKRTQSRPSFGMEHFPYAGYFRQSEAFSPNMEMRIALAEKAVVKLVKSLKERGPSISEADIVADLGEFARGLFEGGDKIGIMKGLSKQ